VSVKRCFKLVDDGSIPYMGVEPTLPINVD
jgi:hypothetical protein